MAARAVREFREVRVYSPRRESREAFAAGHDGGADVILAATSSVVPVIDPAWLKPGMHVGCIKSEEIDGAVLDRCDRVFVHDRKQGQHYSNVMPGTPNMAAERAGGWSEERKGRYPDLAELLAERVPGRERADEITCFANNIGIGLQFTAAGVLALRKAREQGMGKELPDDWFSEDVHP
jgi:ornithine cyclodeaminase/alanine dehydrogenase-like protein (mu-crystallin family)